MENGPQLHVLGIGGCVLAVDPATGTEIWRRRLRGSDFVTVSWAGRQILAGTGGELFCLDVSDGQILWHNKLRGLGTGIICFSSTDEAAALAALEAKRKSAAAAASAAT